MFPDDAGPAGAAIAFADQFVEAGAAKLDALFGAGYAKANPQMLGAYVTACASNVNAFMTAAAAMAEASLDDAFGDETDDDLAQTALDLHEALSALAAMPEPGPARPKRKRR